MVDPFFTTGNTSGNSAASNVDTTKSIDTLMEEQTEIQDKYKELKELLQNEDLTQNQKDEIKEQMQKLSDLYSHNKETIAALSTNIAGEKEIHVNKNVNPDESNSKNFSFRKIMIGCGIIFLLLLGGLVAIFYSLMDNPNRLNSFGISGCTAVNLLQIFSIIFFGLVFLVGLALLLVNIYKLVVSKNKRKFGFALGSLFGTIIGVLSIMGLIFMRNKLNVYALECNERGNTDLANLEIRVKNSKFKDDILPKSEYGKLIAPINVDFKLNSTVYKNTVAPTLGAADNVTITLNCGNGEQEISLSSDNTTFEDHCFYTDKGNYSPELIVQYTDASPTIKENRFALPKIGIASAVSVSSEQGQVKPRNSTLLVGENPVNLKFNASDIFKDFNLSSYHIKRSAECNGSRDNSSSVDFSHQYNKEGVQEVCFAFPDLNDYIYTFPIRVEQGKIPDDFSISYNVTTSRGGSYDNVGTIEVSDIPTTLNIKITNVSPDSATVQKKLFVNGEVHPSVFTDPNLFKVIIDEEKNYVLTLEISDPDREIQTTKTINVNVNRAEVVGKLSITPDTVGISPFTVKFDASTTTLNDTKDEIVYFSRDFGDGETNKNLSESVISHTYEYNFETENGVYYPTVEMTTKKGRKFSITGTIISVKKPDTTISISLDDHPAQIAKIGEIVSMSLSLDGMPKKVYRDFGDGDNLECDGRLCTEINHIYEAPGSYSISARVEFDGKPTLDGRINLLVQ